MLIVKEQEVQKWTTDTQAIVVDSNDTGLTVVAPGPITAAAGAYKYVTTFGLEVNRARVAKLDKNRWQIKLN